MFPVKLFLNFESLFVGVDIATSDVSSFWILAFEFGDADECVFVCNEICVHWYYWVFGKMSVLVENLLCILFDHDGTIVFRVIAIVKTK